MCSSDTVSRLDGSEHEVIDEVVTSTTFDICSVNDESLIKSKW